MNQLINLLRGIGVQVVFTNSVKTGHYSTNKVISINRDCLYKNNILKHEFIHAVQHYVWEFDILPLPSFVYTEQQQMYAETVLKQAGSIIDRTDPHQYIEFQAICGELLSLEELITLFNKYIA